jgi:hypothetical protein
VRIGRAGVAALAPLLVSATLAATASSAAAGNGSGQRLSGHDDRRPVSYHTVHEPDGRVDGVSYDDADLNRVVCDDDIPRLRIRVFYFAPFLDFGHGHVPIVIDWGDGTHDAVPSFPNPHSPDPFRPYELVHTYPSGFATTGVAIHDNWHDLLGEAEGHREGAPLDVLRDSCPSESPPPLLPETPVAVLLPLSAAVVAGTWFTGRRRRRRRSA